MLMHTQASRLAHRILNSRAENRLISPLSADAALTPADAYEIARCILDDQIAEGEVPVGRKIGFTNRKTWGSNREGESITVPIWGTMYASTVRYLEDDRAVQKLARLQQPRVEPEIVFKLRKAPGPDADLAEIADCLEWMAHGCEIAACPFPEWEFETVDAIAAFGLHGITIIGEPRILSPATRRNLAGLLKESSISLSRARDGATGICAAGFGHDVLGSPVHALLHLHRLLLSQPQFTPLAAGELISTGSWTDAYPVTAGETWMTALCGVSLTGLTLSFV